MATNLVPRALFPAFGGGAAHLQSSKAREKRPGNEVEWQPDPDIKPGYNVLVLSVFFFLLLFHCCYLNRPNMPLLEGCQ